MARKDDEPKFRLRPPKPKARREGSTLATGFKRLMHFARTSSTGGGSSAKRSARPAYNQRCAVRVTYSKNATKGQWRAHGRYVARDSATLGVEPESGGFSAEKEGIDVASELDRWQRDHDPLTWKLILSPEFGDRLDLKQITREVMERMAKDLKADLEWVAVSHYNTDHPHVHIALRGLTAEGQVLQLNREYIKSGIRHVAEDACTMQLGYRNQIDLAEAERREISELRLTSLDRHILRRAAGDHPYHFSVATDRQKLSRDPASREQNVANRLATLEGVGLAERSGPGVWHVRRDFESILRAFQRGHDHQKTLSAHGVVPSDERLPINLFRWAHHGGAVQGRVLVHGQEESSGRNYLMLEGTDAIIHLIYYSPEMEELRNQGGLRTNSFLKLHRLSRPGGESFVEVSQLGDAEALFSDRRHFDAEALDLLRHDKVPAEEQWGGWLGRYHAALREASSRIQTPNKGERGVGRDDSGLGR